jgi:hypothetical protein
MLVMVALQNAIYFKIKERLVSKEGKHMAGGRERCLMRLKPHDSSFFQKEDLSHWLRGASNYHVTRMANGVALMAHEQSFSFQLKVSESHMKIREMAWQRNGIKKPLDTTLNIVFSVTNSNCLAQY